MLLEFRPEKARLHAVSIEPSIGPGRGTVDVPTYAEPDPCYELLESECWRLAIKILTLGDHGHGLQASLSLGCIAHTGWAV